MPPVSLAPTELALGRYFESKNDATRALEIYQEGLARWPKDLTLLDAIASLQTKAGDDKAAAQTRAMMQEVRSEN